MILSEEKRDNKGEHVMTMSRTIVGAAVIFALALLPGPVFSADYQSMSTEELSALRGTLSQVTQEERNAFRAEWLKRVQQMTPAEKEQYLTKRAGGGAGNRDSTGLGSGSGQGSGQGGGGQNRR